MFMSVHEHQRLASYILTFSFVVGYLFIKLFLINIFSLDSLTKLWLLISVIPLLIVAYYQNPHKKSKFNLNNTNIDRIKSKIIILILQVVLIYTYAFIITNIGLANYSMLVDDLFLGFPIITISIVGYVYFVDRRLLDPEDEYANIGRMLSKKSAIDKKIVKSFALKTLVKIVFIPYMYSVFLINLTILLNTPWQFNPNAISLLLFNFGISIDVLIGIFGYLFSSAIINNQVIDTDSNFLGWLFALLCYPPLLWIMRQANEQQDSLVWYQIIPQDTILYWILFTVINITWIVHWLATFEFGMTFSNLSYRRLIYQGAYRYTKHPAYISKNLYWWLYTLPFMGVVALSPEWWKNILGLTFVSLIYYGRAKSEERHLMKFPEYRQYSEEINKRGIFRWLKLNPTY